MAFDIVYRVDGTDTQSDGLAGQSLHKDLYTAAEAKDEVQGAFLLDVCMVVQQSAPILKLLSREDQSLLIRRDAFLALNLGL